MKPDRKVAAAGVAGSVTTVVVWAAGQAGVVIPPEVAAAVATIIAFAAGYVRAPSS